MSKQWCHVSGCHSQNLGFFIVKHTDCQLRRAAKCGSPVLLLCGSGLTSDKRLAKRQCLALSPFNRVMKGKEGLPSSPSDPKGRGAGTRCPLVAVLRAIQCSSA